jgi:hypothetical protein
MGRFADGLTSLEKISSYNGEYYFWRAQALLGVMQAESAWNDLSRSISLQSSSRPQTSDRMPPSANEIFFKLIGLSTIVAFPQSAIVGAFRQALAAGVSDAYLSNGLMIFFRNWII